MAKSSVVAKPKAPVKSKSAVKAKAFTIPLTAFQHLIDVLKGTVKASLRDTGKAVLELLQWIVEISTPATGSEESAEIFSVQVKAKGSKAVPAKMTKAKLINALEAIVESPVQAKGVSGYLWLIPILLDILNKLRAGKSV